MHLTSSLIVTGVVIYTSQGVGSGESGPLPRKLFRFILGCDATLLFSTVCISHLTCVMLMQVHCVGCSTRVKSHSHPVKLCACWCRSYGNLARQSCVLPRVVFSVATWILIKIDISLIVEQMCKNLSPTKTRRGICLVLPHTGYAVVSDDIMLFIQLNKFVVKWHLLLVVITRPTGSNNEVLKLASLKIKM